MQLIILVVILFLSYCTDCKFNYISRCMFYNLCIFDCNRICIGYIYNYRFCIYKHTLVDFPMSNNPQLFNLIFGTRVQNFYYYIQQNKSQNFYLQISSLSVLDYNIMYRNLFKIFKRSLPLLVVPVTLKTYNCFFWSKKHQQNLIDNRVFIDVEISNKPCQDRSSKLQLKNIKGYAVAVFDGHGGWQVSHFCSQTLLQKLDERIGINKQRIQDQEQLIKTSLRDAFQQVQNQFLQTARKGYKLGFGRMARAGSCALVCVVVNNKVYSANAGDSLGLIIEQDENKRMQYIQINNQLNVNKKEQRQRLRKLFPLQQDIVICKKQNQSSCYVKGRLQPTRSIGDLRLKHAQFNNPEGHSTDHDFQSSLKTFTGPYITWQPQINVFPIKKTYKSVILASDGLWDELQRQQVAELFKSNQITNMPKVLIQRALEKAAKEANTTIQGLRQIPQGKKRKLHDDITVVVVDLQQQFKN